MRSRSDGGEDVIGVRSDDGEDLGGFEEGGEMLVEVGALREEGFEVDVERTLVSDAFMEEAGHCSDVCEGPDLGKGIGGSEIDGELLGLGLGRG